MKLYAQVLALLLTVHAIEPARILSVIPTATKSHYSSCRRVILELARKGHEVVSISPYEERDPPPNFKWIQVEVESIMDALPGLMNEMNQDRDFFATQRHVWSVINRYSAFIAKLPILKRFIERDNSHFDLVIVEEFGQQFFYQFSHKYKAPLVLMSSFGNAHYINQYMGNALELSYVPHEFSDMFGEMTLWQRAKNLAYTAHDLLMRKRHVHSFQDELAREVFKGLGDLPKVEDLERNASLVLMNSHFSMSVVKPLMPNMIEIGGSHIEETKPLKEDLKKILDEATSGAILFSFGSFLQLAEFPEPLVVSVLKALGRIPQRVLLRWDPKVKFPVSSPNIYPMAWLPQNDILAHPNIVGFVTHGGLLSSQEAIYHGVPTICVPSFGDQPLNCRKSVQIGYGLQIQLADLTEDALHDAIAKLTTDKKYNATAKELSKRFRGRQNSPVDTAVYWIEYVIEHKGADFMKGPRRNMPWYQYYMVDIALVCLLALWVVKKSLCLICSLLFKRRSVRVEKLKKN